MRRLLLLLPFIVLVTTWATACSDDSPSSNKATAPVGSPTAATSATAMQPKELKEVKVGYVPIFNFAPLYVGVDKGYFAAEGIKVSLERLAGGADMLVQTAAGNFNVGSGGV
ncbi:MAG: ABC transporter substrate-binding protein, partial [Dehalococcoidia bacterium]|nr:ABC transporter substrate-binding protein [Dehalococcoidia bacterium]